MGREGKGSFQQFIFCERILLSHNKILFNLLGRKTFFKKSQQNVTEWLWNVLHVPYQGLKAWEGRDFLAEFLPSSRYFKGA